MPSVISAPSAKFATAATASRAGDRPSASPPSGTRPSCVISMTEAAASRATPMPRWMRGRLQRETTPAPSQAPITAAAIMTVSVGMATETIAM